MDKPVTYVPISIEAVGEAIRNAGWGEWGANVMMDYSKAYAEGWGEFTNDDVEIITRKNPAVSNNFTMKFLPSPEVPSARNTL